MSSFALPKPAFAPPTPAPVDGPPAPPPPAPLGPPAPPVQPKPDLSVKPFAPPEPIFQQLGSPAPLSVPEFNHRIETVTAAHVAATGVQPKPGDALATVLAGPVGTPSPAPGLQAAGTKAELTTSYVGLSPVLAQHPALTDQQFFTEFAQAAGTPAGYQTFLQQNGSRLAELQHDPLWGVKVSAVVNGVTSKFPTTGALTQEAGILPTSGLTDLAGAVVHTVAAGGTDLARTTANVVVGVWDMFKTEYLADKWAVEHPSTIEHPERPNPYIAREKAIEVGLAKQTYDQLRHPENHPISAALDILGIAAPAFGIAGRTVAFGKAAAAAEDAGVLGKTAAGAKAFTAEFQPQTYAISKGGYSENLPLFRNPFTAWLQVNAPVFGLDARQARIDARVAEMSYTSKATATSNPLAWATRALALEGKIGRLGDARRRVEYAAAEAPVQALDEAVGTAWSYGKILDKAPPRIFRGLSAGEMRAIQVISRDDLDPLAAERASDLRNIDLNIGDPEAHQRDLALLDLAEKALKDPSPRFVRAVQAAARVSAENERIRIEDLGLEPTTAESRIARTGAFLRGEGEKTHQPEHYTSPFLQGEIEELNRRLGANLKAQAGPQGQSAGSLARLQRTETSLRAQIKERSERVGITPLERVVKPGMKRPALGPALEHQEPFYIPEHTTNVPRAPKPGTSAGFTRSSVGSYGMSPAASAPELAHEYTGAGIREGNSRWDASNLLRESYAKTIKVRAVSKDWQDAWDAGTEQKMSDWDIAVRNERTISPELRQALASFDHGFVTHGDLDAMPEDVRSLIKQLYVFPDKAQPGELDALKKLEESGDVRWIDQRLLGQSAKPPIQGFGPAFDKYLNNWLRPLIFYIYPKYILNKLNNDAMLIFDQGIWNTGVNLAKSMRAESLYGEENANKIRSVVGAGRQSSYVTSRSGHVNQALAHFWNRWADRDERVASFIHYAALKGYRSPEEMDALLNGIRFDKGTVLTDAQQAELESRNAQLQKDFTEVSQRGKKALVEYDALSPVEKAYIRQMLFVWPWVHGSTVWSFRAVFEHPARAAILAAISNQGAAQNDPWLKEAPLWMKRVGYIPVAWDGKNPVVVDASQLNTWSTMSQLESVVQAGVEGDPYATAGDLLGPIGSFAVHGFTGKNSQGTAYKGSQWFGAAKDALQIVPILAAIERHQRVAKAAGKTLPPFQITNRASLEARLNHALHQTVLTPDWLGGYGNLLAGGFSPSTINLNAAAARYWHTATPGQRATRELDLLNRALTIQGEYLGRAVPANVRAAMSDGAKLTLAYAAHAKAIGRTPTLADKRKFTIEFLEKEGRIPPAEAAALQAKKFDIKGKIIASTAAILVKYGHLGDLHDWDRDVRQVHDLSPAYLNQAAAQLHSDGINPQRQYQVKPAALHSYALGYSAYLNEYRAMAADKKNTSADLRVFEDEHDHPVNGLPSYVALKWAGATPAAQQKAIVRASVGPWASLNGFEKRLVGRPVAAGVGEAWRFYTLERKKVEVEAGRTLAANQTTALVKAVDHYYDLKGAFFKDYLFSKQRLYQRLPYTRLIRDSPNQAQWHHLLGQANAAEALVAAGRNTQASVTTAWDDYAVQAEAHYRTDDPAFYAELQRYLTENPRFLADLIR